MFKLRSEVWARNGRLLLWAVVAILAVNAGRLAYRGLRLPSVRAASPAPFTVFRTEHVFDTAGTLRVTNHYVEALRSDGSTMWRGTTNDVQSRRIQFANGDLVTTDELTGRKSTYPKKYAGPPAPRDPSAHCAALQELDSRWTTGGEETIAGHRAVRRVMNVGGGRKLTMWYGLDAGCSVLKQRLEHETGVTEQNLDALTLGEPDPALFQLSAALSEGPPSQLYDCPGGACTPLPDEFKQRMDKSYYDLRAQK